MNTAPYLVTAKIKILPSGCATLVAPASVATAATVDIIAASDSSILTSTRRGLPRIRGSSMVRRRRESTNRLLWMAGRSLLARNDDGRLRQRKLYVWMVCIILHQRMASAFYGRINRCYKSISLFGVEWTGLGWAGWTRTVKARKEAKQIRRPGWLFIYLSIYLLIRWWQ